MKKVLVSLTLVALIASCATSKTGDWSKRDIQKVRKEIQLVESDLRATLASDTDAFIECYIQRIIETFPNFEAANSDEAGCSKLAEECVYEVLGN